MKWYELIRKTTRENQMSDSFILAAILAFSGGFQDAYTYVARGGVFANAQTGNVVLMSGALLRLEWATVQRYLIPLIAFMLGVVTAEAIHAHTPARRALHWRQVCLIGEIAIMLVSGLMPTSMNSIVNPLISFACAMQVQSFRRVGSVSYASTMCIGNMRGGSEALYVFLRTRDRTYLHITGYYFGVIIAFALGAGVGVGVSRALGERAIWFSALALAAGFILMLPDSRNDDAQRG